MLFRVWRPLNNNSKRAKAMNDSTCLLRLWIVDDASLRAFFSSRSSPLEVFPDTIQIPIVCISTSHSSKFCSVCRSHIWSCIRQFIYLRMWLCLSRLLFIEAPRLDKLWLDTFYLRCASLFFSNHTEHKGRRGERTKRENFHDCERLARRRPWWLIKYSQVYRIEMATDNFLLLYMKTAASSCESSDMTGARRVCVGVEEGKKATRREMGKS